MVNKITLYFSFKRIAIMYEIYQHLGFRAKQYRPWDLIKTRKKGREETLFLLSLFANLGHFVINGPNF